MKRIYLDTNRDLWRMVFDLEPDNSIDDVLDEITKGKVTKLPTNKKPKKEKALKPTGKTKPVIRFKKIG